MLDFPKKSRLGALVLDIMPQMIGTDDDKILKMSLGTSERKSKFIGRKAQKISPDPDIFETTAKHSFTISVHVMLILLDQPAQQRTAIITSV